MSIGKGRIRESTGNGGSGRVPEKGKIGEGVESGRVPENYQIKKG